MAKKQRRRAADFAGTTRLYNEYRFGCRRPVYVPGKGPQRTINSAKEASVIDSLARGFQCWTRSPFEREGASVAGLRSALCLEGNDWSKSDAYARHLVQSALDAIGAKRPTWNEGQPDYTYGPEQCRWCAGPIDDERAALGLRFCSAECFNAARVHRSFEFGWSEDRAMMLAYKLVHRIEQEKRACAFCGKAFYPRDDGDYTQRFCSRRCHGLSKRTLEQVCVVCGTQFRTENSTRKKTCSDACAAVLRQQPRFVKTCAWCRQEFVSKTNAAKYCCRACADSGQKAETGWQPDWLTWHVFDRYFGAEVGCGHHAVG